MKEFLEETDAKKNLIDLLEEKYRLNDETVNVHTTGHSLGGALATLMSLELLKLC